MIRSRNFRSFGNLFRALGLASICLVAACGEEETPWAPPAPPPPPAKEAMYLELEQGDIATADKILNDTWPARGFPDAKLGWPLKWTEDPYNDAYFRFMFYSLRYTQHLLFAHRHRATGDSKYIEKLYAILRSYLEYDSTRQYDRLRFDNEHATAYRAMVLTNMFVKLQQSKELPEDIANGIRASIKRVAAYLMDAKRFEAWANHGFTEAAALLVLAHNFSDLEGAEEWRQKGIARLEQMRITNVDSDGVDIENSPFYHMFVLGLVVQIGAWAEQYEPSIAAKWEETKRSMIHYLAYVTQPNGRLPTLGATGSTIVPNQDPLLFAHLASHDPEFAWVWSSGKGGTPPSKRAELFPVSGLFVLRAPKPALEQTFVTFDAGIYRTDHSHLDGLSVTLYSDSAALVPDGGLFTYEKGVDYDYFHGTRSHNTIIVDGKDQLDGDATPGAYGVAGKVAWATGSSNLYEGVTHKRTVIIVDQGIVVIADDLESEAPHEYTQLWHLFPGGGVELKGLNVDVDNIKGAPILQIRPGDVEELSARDIFGQEQPVMQGWVSPSFGKKEKAHTIEYARKGTNAKLSTLFVTGKRARAKVATTMKSSFDAQTNERVFQVCGGDANVTLRVRDAGKPNAVVTASDGGC